MDNKLDYKNVILAGQSKSFLAWMANQAQHLQVRISLANDLESLIKSLSNDVHFSAIFIDTALALEDEEEFTQKLIKVRHVFKGNIVLITESETSELIKQAVNNGIDYFFDKNFLTKNISSVLNLCLKGKDLENDSLAIYKKMISSYKHDLGNIISIVFGKQMKFEMLHPTLATDPTYLTIKQTNEKLKDILNKLDALRKYPEEIVPLLASDLEKKTS